MSWCNQKKWRREMGTSALVFVTGRDQEGAPFSARMYRHYDGYPDESLHDIARLLSRDPLCPGDAGRIVRVLQDGSMDEKEKPDFRLEGGPWRAPLGPRHLGTDVVEWVYRVDADRMRIDVFGRGAGGHVEGTAKELLAHGPVDPLAYIKPIHGADTIERVERAMAILDRAGYGVCEDSPTEGSRDAKALASLAAAKPKATLADLYDTDERVASACIRLIPGFEYPDYSWKAMSRIHAEAAAVVASRANPPGGLDYRGEAERTIGGAGDSTRANKNKKEMLMAKEGKGAEGARHPDGVPFAIAVPYAQREEAGSMGAEWYPTLKTWAIPEGSDRGAFSKWFPKVEGGEASDAAARSANEVFADTTGKKAGDALLEAVADPKISAYACMQLVNIGADPNAHAAKRESALHRAAAFGAHKAVKALAESGADVAASDSEGMTPLHRAAEGGWAKTAEALLAAGANIDAADAKGRTPLLKAAYYGRADAVTALLKAGADPAARDADDKGVDEAVDAAMKGKRAPLPQDAADAVRAAIAAQVEPAAKDAGAKTAEGDGAKTGGGRKRQALAARAA